VRNELFKLLRARDPTTVWGEMVRTGIVARLLPAATRVDVLARLIAVESVLGLTGDPIRRLAALAGPLSAGDLDRLKVRLKLSNRDAEMLAACIEPAAGVASLTESQFARALYATDPASLFNSALIAHARSGDPDVAMLSELRDFSVRWVRPQFPVTGTDIVARGVAPGPTVGSMLAELEAWWIARDFVPARDTCLAELERRLKGA
jgi:poly(A) polymerase